MHPLVCAHCGAWSEVPQVDQSPAAGSPATLRCTECGHRREFRRLPLYCLTGPSGTGKSTVARLLLEGLRDRFVVLEQDVLWLDGLRDPADDHRSFRSAWLRMAASIHQGGRPVVLCGTVVPPELEHLPERALFSAVHYLGLTGDSDVLAGRLKRRPQWRAWTPERIAETQRFNEWLRDSAPRLRPPVRLRDTTEEPPEATAAAVREWIESRAAER